MRPTCAVRSSIDAAAKPDAANAFRAAPMSLTRFSSIVSARRFVAKATPSSHIRSVYEFDGLS